MSECQTKAGNQECFEKLEKLSLLLFSLISLLSPLLLLSLFHSLYLDMLNNFCFHVYAQKSLSHSFAFTTFATFTTFTTFNLSINHSRHAEQVLFSSLCWKLTVYCWKLQWFFFDHIITLSCDSWVHRAGSQLKIPCSTWAGYQNKSIKRSKILKRSPVGFLPLRILAVSLP